MANLEKFVTETLDSNEETIQKLKKFETILRSLHKKEKVIYPTFEIKSNI